MRPVNDNHPFTGPLTHRLAVENLDCRVPLLVPELGFLISHLELTRATKGGVFPSAVTGSKRNVLLGSTSVRDLGMTRSSP
jgi:hypothetical protein